MKRKPVEKRPLEPDEKRASIALKAHWVAKKKELGFKNQDELLEEGAPEKWTQSTVSQHMTGQHAINLQAVLFYSRVLKIDAFDIASNAVRLLLDRASEVNAPVAFGDDFIGAYLGDDARLSGGDGSVNEDSMLYGKPILFHRSFLESRNLTETDLRVYRVSGNSMGPKIEDGDIVAGRADRIEKPLDDTLYFITFEGLDYIKRLHVDKESEVITIVSDNPSESEGFPRVVTQNNQDQLILKAEIFHRAGYVS